MISDISQNPPSKASLKAWWSNFTFAQRAKKERDPYKDEPPHTVFGKTLRESLQYASVQISTANSNGELYVWGYIPVVVAKCGLYLKENATEVPGTFRVSGSNKRMRELQALFETPPRYGKNLDWKQETYTTHDVASVFRRYLTQMPEPVIPHDMYHKFRDALARTPHNQEEVIRTYKQLIRSLPQFNQYLLLYVLDLLSVFARKADKNLMTASNLAVIFRPGIINHPSHEMSPEEHAPSQRVLEFLIAHQDWFMLEISSPNRGGSPGFGIDDVIVSPGSDEESPQVGGGWRPSGANKEKVRVMRRRTTVDRPAHGVLAEGDMSPVAESPSPPGKEGATGVTRSRTLPSQRRGGAPESSERNRLLKKQKRASSSQPNRTGILDPPNNG
ncbi:Rho GTPase activation protein [Infundibulicybe gibba]|nr:Rho GTPase activation protein [Infundibulicybe gibba]